MSPFLLSLQHPSPQESFSACIAIAPAACGVPCSLWTPSFRCLLLPQLLHHGLPLPPLPAPTSGYPRFTSSVSSAATLQDTGSRPPLLAVLSPIRILNCSARTTCRTKSSVSVGSLVIIWFRTYPLTLIIMAKGQKWLLIFLEHNALKILYEKNCEKIHIPC